MLNNKSVDYGYALAWGHFIDGKKIKFLKHIIQEFEEREEYEVCVGIYKSVNDYKKYIDTMKKLMKRSITKDI